MKAIAITQAAADGNNIPSLTEIDLPIPTAHGRDLLVAVKAISVNPVDTKVRAGFQGDTPRVLGWDAVGVVQSVGEEVTLFAPGDEVWYAGALGRATSTMPCFSCATRRTPSICARRGRDRTPSMPMSRCPIFRRL